jgi:hypothetical protein
MTKSVQTGAAVIAVVGLLGVACSIDVAWSASPIQIHTTTIHTPKINTPSTGKSPVSSTVQQNLNTANTLNVGSQSGGAGAGKATFNQFSITKKVDKSSPAFFENATAPPTPANAGGGKRIGW